MIVSLWFKIPFMNPIEESKIENKGTIFIFDVNNNES